MSMSLFRQTWRRLWKTPGSTVAAVVCVALGVGAASAILAVLYAVLLKPLPYPKPEELVTVWEVSPQPDQGDSHTYLSIESFLNIRRATRLLSAVAAYNLEPTVLTGRGEPRRLSGAVASTALFTQVLKVSADRGRLFQPPDELAANAKVALLSHSLWRRSFGGDPGVLGQTITLDDQPYTVVGVLPASFQFENPEPDLLEKVDLWRPLVAQSYHEYGAGLRFLRCIGRLRPTANLKQASDELAGVAKSMGEQFPETNSGWGLTLEPLLEQLVGHVRLELAILLGSVALVFLIAAGNVSNLLLVRAIERGGEMALRAACGAGRRQIFQQLLAESLAVSLLGGALGVFFALWMTHLLVALSPVELPRLADAELGNDVVLAALTTSVLISLLCVLPAMGATWRHFSMDLLRRAEGGTETRPNVRLRNALVLAELSMAMALLASGALLLNSFWRLGKVDLGFVPSGVLTSQLELPWSHYGEPHKILDFYDQLGERVAALPDVEAVGLVKDLPLTGQETTLPITAEPSSAALSQGKLTVSVRIVSPGYFRALGEHLAEGRLFDVKTADGGVVLNRALARQLWPGVSPLGKTVGVNWFGKAIGGPVVGVVEDIRHRSVDAPAEPAVYINFVRLPYPTMNLVVRTRANPLSLAAPIRGVVSSFDRNLPVEHVETMSQVLSRGMDRQRFLAVLIVAFAAIAVALAGIGLYGIVSYTVQRSTRQIAIRMVLGALPGTEVNRILRRIALLLAGGLAIGLVLVFAAGEVLTRVLFDVAPTDPATLAAAVTVLSVIVLLAAYLPARKATHLDPVTALRHD
jgi:putative ABC transport system permease protein